MKAKRFLANRIVAADDSGAAKWNMLFPKGTWARRDFPNGRFSFTAEWFQQMKANWEAHGRPALPVDYHHDDQDVASGWIEDLDVRADGLYGLVKWNTPALAHLKVDEYRYLSPSWFFNSKDRHDGKDQGPELLGAALLNDPFFDEMPRVAASRLNPAEPPAEETTMNKKLVCQLLKSHGHDINDSDSDDTVNAALEKALSAAKAQVPTDEKVKAAVEPLKGALDAATKQLAAAAEENKKQADRIEALETAKKDGELGALVKELIDGNHIVAAQCDAVKAFAKVQGIEEARKVFAAFTAHALTPEKGHSGNPADETSPEGANKKLEALVTELAEKEKLPFSAARERVYATVAHRKLVDTAAKLIGETRPN